MTYNRSAEVPYMERLCNVGWRIVNNDCLSFALVTWAVIFIESNSFKVFCKTSLTDEEVEITVNVYDDSRVKLFYVRFGSDDIVKNIKILKKIKEYFNAN